MILLATIGLTFILTDSKMFKRFRESISLKAKDKKCLKKIDEVINCPQCLGFWVGLFFSFYVGGLMILPFATSFVCYFFSKIIRYIDRH